jgi:hypothetical protein
VIKSKTPRGVWRSNILSSRGCAHQQEIQSPPRKVWKSSGISYEDFIITVRSCDAELGDQNEAVPSRAAPKTGDSAVKRASEQAELMSSAGAKILKSWLRSGAPVRQHMADKAWE